MQESRSDLSIALSEGNPLKVRALIKAGADVRYQRPDGYDALIDAVHGRDVRRDPTLLVLLQLLITSGVDLSGLSTYQESGLRVLSRVGRFDAVRLLVDAGADRSQLGWTPLMEAVALGSLPDVETVLEGGATLEETDWWSRTAWLIVLLAGDVAKAKLLLAHGANPNACGRCGKPPLFYAIDGHHPDVLRWLLEGGADVEETDDFGTTPLMEAAEISDLESLEILLSAGADLDREANGTALSRARTREIARRLLEAGSDPANLSYEGRRAVLGFPPDPDEALVTASPDDFRRACTQSFGTANPERINEPFWETMIRSGITAYAAGRLFNDSSSALVEPVWSAQRFGQSINFLPDGRVVQIAGEHEDFYAPDFCIYNDVFVHGLDGSIAIFGYPESVFPPTDFHTATLVGDYIYVIGSLGYQGTRRYGETRVYRLDVGTFRMERLDARGDAPGGFISIGRFRQVLARSASGVARWLPEEAATRKPITRTSILSCSISIAISGAVRQRRGRRECVCLDRPHRHSPWYNHFDSDLGLLLQTRYQSPLLRKAPFRTDNRAVGNQTADRTRHMMLALRRTIHSSPRRASSG